VSSWSAADWRRYAVFAAKQTGTPLSFFMQMRPAAFLAWLGTAAETVRARHG